MTDVYHPPFSRASEQNRILSTLSDMSHDLLIPALINLQRMLAHVERGNEIVLLTGELIDALAPVKDKVRLVGMPLPEHALMPLEERQQNCPPYR